MQQYNLFSLPLLFRLDLCTIATTESYYNIKIIFCFDLSCCGGREQGHFVFCCCSRRCPFFGHRQALFNMLRANKKQASAASQPSSNPKRVATAATAKGHGKARAASKKSGITLSTLGFSSSKHPPIHIGTKVLLDKSNYGKSQFMSYNSLKNKKRTTTTLKLMM
jgi:hypothetical protein